MPTRTRPCRITPRRESIAVVMRCLGLAAVTVGLTGCAQDGQIARFSWLQGNQALQQESESDGDRSQSASVSESTRMNPADSASTWVEPISMQEAFEELQRYSSIQSTDGQSGYIQAVSHSTERAETTDSPVHMQTRGHSSMNRNPLPCQVPSWSADKAIETQE